MVDERANISDPGAEPPGQEDPWSKPPVAVSPSAEEGKRRRGRDGSGAGGRKRKPWTWKRILRWVANAMIICGIIGLPGYFLSTCAYTALQQRSLRHTLEASSPQLTSAEASPTGSGFIPMKITTTSTTGSTTNSTDSSSSSSGYSDPMSAIIAERDAELAVLRTAADAFSASVGGLIGKPIGKIIIPSIGLNVVMVEGTSTGDLKEGPGHWEETPFPGEGGNFVVSGHRTTYGAPFFKLNDIKVGDEIDIVLPYVVARYTVTETLIVYPNQVDSVRQAGHEQVSLAACHPIYSAKQRIVVKGDLSSFKLLSQDQSGATTTTTGGPPST
jgi:LPXTG-site transpeptidase (sortase) family protein